MGKVKEVLIAEEEAVTRADHLRAVSGTQTHTVFEKYYSRFDINQVFNDLVDRQENMHLDGTYCVTIVRKEF